MTRGKFIVFEGIDGAGKSTQLKLLKDRLFSLGYGVVDTREPGGTTVGEKIRELLLDPQHDGLDECAEVFLYAAARAELLRRVIKPSLAGGCVVLCDRFTASTIAYQGYGRGVDLDFLRRVNELTVSGVNFKQNAGTKMSLGSKGAGDAASVAPDLVLLLDLPPQVGLRRVQGSGKTLDRFEKETLAFYSRVRAGYLAMAREAPAIFKVIDARLEVEKAHEKIWYLVKEIL